MCALSLYLLQVIFWAFHSVVPVHTSSHLNFYHYYLEARDSSFLRPRTVVFLCRACMHIVGERYGACTGGVHISFEGSAQQKLAKKVAVEACPEVAWADVKQVPSVGG